MADIHVPMDIRHNMALELAEMLRDKLNSYYGRDRFSVSSLQDTPGNTVIIMMKDEDFPEGMLYAEWEPGFNVDVAMELIIANAVVEDQSD